ncbi:DUF2510 domain-containing protein [Mycobacterium sp. B14F4]|uniref:DUF2510 domain-containing protein n=1 Tax=Mycobacterium sp. B14F4 TaxID=3153565 RepID=UPI00325F8D43
MTVPDRWEPPPLSKPAETTRISRPDDYADVYLPPPTAPAAPAVAAAWYPDPTNAGLMRYWDGTQWTEHRAAAAPQASAVVYNNVAVRGGGDSLVGLHIVLTILTCGLWLPIWLLIEIIRAVSR